MEQVEQETWITAFTQRDDLKKYKDNALGLFALALKFSLDDLDTVAAETITDGSDDKCTDLLYVDNEQGIAVIAQCYFSKTPKDTAPAKKASDLNTAITWILNTSEKNLPSTIKSQAIKLREAIKIGKINSIHAWYVHNCGQSENVKAELSAVEHTLKNSIKANYSNNQSIEINVLEVGQELLATWYAETQSPIVVHNEFIFNCKNGFETKNDKWRVFVTALPAAELHKIYKIHKTALFSANVRDYLGSRATESNINNGIKNTIKENPQNFFVYNNGITALTHNFEYDSELEFDNLKIIGLSIVNGAQTTGALGGLDFVPAESALVPIRFVASADNDLIQNIVRYNNSQNQITASDFRSTDQIQIRLKKEFSFIQNSDYSGGRRGGLGDAIKRRSSLLPSYTVGQALSAFHGDPVQAYNGKTEIWANDTLYAKIFNEKTTAQHIIFAYGLLRAIENMKLSLFARSKSKHTNLMQVEKDQVDFFRRAGSTYVFISALSESLEIICNEAIANKFNLSFGPKTSHKRSEKLWEPIVERTLPIATRMRENLENGISTQTASSAIKDFKTFLGTVYAMDTTHFSKFWGYIKHSKL